MPIDVKYRAVEKGRLGYREVVAVCTAEPEPSRNGSGTRPAGTQVPERS